MDRPTLERLKTLCKNAAAENQRLPGVEEEYRNLREELLALARGRPFQIAPEFLRNASSLADVRRELRKQSDGWERRRELIDEGFSNAIKFIDSQRDVPDFATNAEDFCARLVPILMARQLTRAVGFLTFSRAEFALADDALGPSDEGWPWELRLFVPVHLLARFNDDNERANVTRQIEAAGKEVVRALNKRDGLSVVQIVVDPLPMDDWRKKALAWLRGSGINNQGRVRSDNLPGHQVDGLYFRSKAEINMYRALKVRGVVFAPLPVFLRGGDTPKRIEPDFVVIKDGQTMVVEVDGDAFHRELPADAEDRVRMLKHHGVYVERVNAELCATGAGAERAADLVLETIERIKTSR